MTARQNAAEGVCAAGAVLVSGLLIVQHDLPLPLSWATVVAVTFCANWCLTRPAPLDRTILVMIAAISYATVRTMPAAAEQQPACPAAIVGPATVTDGDTIRVYDYRVRLNGIAAPELRDRGGKAASAALELLVANREVSCTVLDVDRYGRCVAICAVEGVDLGASLARAGAVRDCPRFSGGRYAGDELAGNVTTGITGWYTLPGYCEVR